MIVGQWYGAFQLSFASAKTLTHPSLGAWNACMDK